MPSSERSTFIEELSPAIRRGIQRVRLQPHEAEDAFQQTAIKLLPHLERLATLPEKERLAYAYIAAMRESMAVRNSGRKRLATSLDDAAAKNDGRLADRRPSPETWLRLATDAKRAEAAMMRLTTHDKQMLEDVEQGASGDEIAQKLGVPRRNVVYRLRVARDALRRAWDGRTSWFNSERSRPR